MERPPRIWIAALGLVAAGAAFTFNARSTKPAASRTQAERAVAERKDVVASQTADPKGSRSAASRLASDSPRSLSHDVIGDALPLKEREVPVAIAGDDSPNMAESAPSLSTIDRDDESRPELAAARNVRVPMPSDNVGVAPNAPRSLATSGGQTVTPTEPPPPTAKTPVPPLKLRTTPQVAYSGPIMEPIEAEAMVHVRRGLKLGDRQAFYAARTEFVTALRTLTRAFDAQAGKASADEGAFGASLAAGLRALDEIDNLMPRGAEVDADLDLASVIETHRTPVLKGVGNVNPINAVQQYLDFAVSELSRAGGTNRVASDALYGLGRAHMALRNDPTHEAQMHASKAMACQQAALRISPDNHLALNELGVLYAEFRQYEAAKNALIRSVSISSQPTAWQNLAAIHVRLGEHDLARLAMNERDLAREELGLGGTANRLEEKLIWVSPEKFQGAISRAPATAAKPPSRGPARR